MSIVYAKSTNVKAGHTLKALFSSDRHSTYTINEIAVTNSMSVPYRITFAETSATMDLKALDREPLFIIFDMLDDEEKFLYNIGGMESLLEQDE